MEKVTLWVDLFNLVTASETDEGVAKVSLAVELNRGPLIKAQYFIHYTITA